MLPLEHGVDSGLTIKVEIAKSDNIPDYQPALGERIETLKHQLDLVGIRDEINRWYKSLLEEQQAHYEHMQKLASDGVARIDFIAEC